MNFKVCSCPRRDMEKEECAITNQPLPKKRKAGEPPRHPDGKKPCKVISLPVVKKERSETLTVPYVNAESPSSMPLDDISRTVTLTMPDSESMLFILRQAYNDIVGKMAATKNNPDIYINHARRIKKLMETGKFHFEKPVIF